MKQQNRKDFLCYFAMYMHRGGFKCAFSIPTPFGQDFEQLLENRCC